MPSPTSWGPFMWSLLHDVSNKVDIVSEQYICGSTKIDQEYKRLLNEPRKSNSVNSFSSSNTNIKEEMEQLSEIQHQLQNNSSLMITALRSLFASLKFVLPCTNCRIEFTKFIMTQKDKFFESLSVKCGPPENITKIVVNLHNTVNQRLGKKQQAMSLYKFVDKTEAKRGLWKQNPSYANPITLHKLDFLLKAIRSDDICDPSSSAAQQQRNELVTRYFYDDRAGNTCIALEQFDQFLGALEVLYSLFVNLDPYVMIAGQRGSHRMGLNTLMLNHIKNFRLAQSQV